eukprot:9504095-Pyramimonas_sp.AAC.2
MIGGSCTSSTSDGGSGGTSPTSDLRSVSVDGWDRPRGAIPVPKPLAPMGALVPTLSNPLLACLVVTDQTTNGAST